jgi:alpha-soluble NSF attachment protein
MEGNGSNDPRIQALLREGEQKMKPSLMTKLIWGASYDDAADCFSKAGNLLKNAKNWDEAARAYVKAADAQITGKSHTEAVSSLGNAATCFRKVAPQEAVGCLERAIGMLTDEGRFSMAAKYHKDIAEICENDLSDNKQAAAHYERAAELYEGEPNSSSSVKPCLVKVAHFAAEGGDYVRGKELFEKLAAICLESRLGSYGAKEYLLKAGLCTLAEGDVIAAKKALEKYMDMHPAFEREREFTLFSDVTTAVDNYDLELFMKTVTDYDSLTKIEPFVTTLLLKIKKMIVPEGDQDITAGEGAENEEEGEEGESMLI